MRRKCNVRKRKEKSNEGDEMNERNPTRKKLLGDGRRQEKRRNEKENGKNWREGKENVML